MGGLLHRHLNPNQSTYHQSHNGLHFTLILPPLQQKIHPLDQVTQDLLVFRHHSRSHRFRALFPHQHGAQKTYHHHYAYHSHDHYHTRIVFHAEVREVDKIVRNRSFA